MTISAPQNLGSNSALNAGSDISITTGANIVAHDVIVVIHYANTVTAPLTSCVDSGGVNVYHKILDQHAVAPQADVWICNDAAALASGGTITGSPTSANRQALNALRVPAGLLNAFPWDTHTGNFEVSTATSSPNTAVNNFGATNELILGFFMAGSALGAFTAGTGFTALNSTAGTSATIYTQYQIVSASAYTTNINNAASWVNSVLHRGLSIGLIGACSC